MNKRGQWLSIIGFLIVIILIFGYGFVYAMTTGHETITIKEKWVKYHLGDAKYLVSSTNSQVFEITDTLWKWRWDSSDLYSNLEPGMTCTITTQGWRFPVLSDYKNILEANCNG
jgi:hypothetical protein